MADLNLIDYSKTQRIVLLLDLNPLLHLQNPTPYLTSLLTSSRILLTFPPLSNSLFSFKLFFSSLSPLLSSSTLLKTPNKPASFSPNSLSFDRPFETLISLSQTLDSLSGLSILANGECPSRASFTASSVYQIVHDYAWEVQFQDPLSGQCGDFVRSSLVVMFSPICKSFKGFCDYMTVDEGIGDGFLSSADAFYDKFKELFGRVSDAFDCRDIHFSWVDVGYETGCDNKGIDVDVSVTLLKLFQSGIKRLGWGFCSAESVVLGSSLVPFGLIYPLIGVPAKIYDTKDSCVKAMGKLNLEILDVSGKPLQCTCCDLQLGEISMSPRCKWTDLPPHNGVKLDDGVREQANAFWRQFGNGVTRIDVRSVGQYSDNMKFEGSVCNLILVVDESAEEFKKNSAGVSDQFFADRVLQMLSKDENKVVQKPLPLWQILLSHLCRRSYLALVHLSNTNGSRYVGILKPLTVNSAMLSVIKSEDDTQNAEHGLSKLSWSKFVSNPNPNPNPNPDAGLDSSKGMLGSEKRKKNKSHAANKYEDLSWSSFCKAAYECSVMELEDAYFFSMECGNSKKLKFLKCWMKQVDKCSYSRVCSHNRSAVCRKDPEIVEDRLSQVHEESEQPLLLSSSFSAGQNDLPEPSKLEEATDAIAAPLEVPEDYFFTNLCERIEHGIRSGLDLVTLARRLVYSSILCLNKKVGVDSDQGSQASVENNNNNNKSNYSRAVVTELIKILLKDPKDLHDGNHPAKFSTEERVREYELQILFRMEMLQSEVAAGMKQSMKLKIVKQICSFLEMVQYNVDGGVLGNFNLNDYVGKVIKSRYNESLGDVIDIIYEQLDLLLFEDDDESPNPLLLNSEDSSQSWREKPGREREEFGDNERTSESSLSISTGDSSSPHDPRGGCTKDDEYYAHRLAEAQEKRQRACRLSSFTRGMADLKKVWAPKQPKPTSSRSMSESLQRRCKRKDHQRERYDIVSETPMTGIKRSSSSSHLGHGIGGEDEEPRELGSTPCGGSVYKSLFQDYF
ncbi:hypothetical protein Dimus_000190 [Dionaea muscipula]